MVLKNSYASDKFDILLTVLQLIVIKNIICIIRLFKKCVLNDYVHKGTKWIAIEGNQFQTYRFYLINHRDSTRESKFRLSVAI